MRLSLFLTATLCSALCLHAQDKQNPATSFKKLMEGNQRYIKGESQINENGLEERRKELLSTQDPFAIVIGCSDSRVPPEIVFDQSLGDLFVVRVAGNVLGPIEMDSVQFSADKLKTPLIFVLGHQGCSAVNSVLTGEIADSDLVHIAPQIEKAIRETKNKPGDRLMNVIEQNVRLSMKQLQNDPLLKKLVAKKQLEIRGGTYDLESGEVHLLK